LWPITSWSRGAQFKFRSVDYCTGIAQHTTIIIMANALELVDKAISDLEARLNLKPGQVVEPASADAAAAPKKAKKAKQPQNKPKNQPAAAPPADQPDICKLEFKVGQITKVWTHPEADKLYCEEIDVGEENVRQIASGLRPHFSLEQMQGQRLLVVSNLKAKNLVKFKSHGMVLCAAATLEDGSEKVEFIEPPEGAKIGEVVTFEGLPAPIPFSAAQVEKRKVFLACMDGMKTTEEGAAAWNGHLFITSAGPCTAKTIKGGVMR
jgi:aminoacyl tRNA synthase complex-interacting multifunctional protein 1